MEITYTCTNSNCSHPGSSPYEIRFNVESIMDINNIAATFCPFCKKEMLPKPVPGVTGKNLDGKINQGPA